MELSDNGALSSAQNEWAIKPWTDMRKLTCILVIEESYSGKVISYTIWHSGKGKVKQNKTVKTSDWLGWGIRRRDVQTYHGAMKKFCIIPYW